jgi:hypothetical protein
MNLIQNSIIVLGISILFKGFLFMNDVKNNPSNPDYSYFYGDFKYEVTFKREAIINDSLYYIVSVMDSKYKESERVVSKDEYYSLEKKDVIKDNKLKYDVEVIYYLCGSVFLIIVIGLLVWVSTHKRFVLFSLSDFEE